VHHMYTVGMDVDTNVSTRNVSYGVNLGYMLETSLYITCIVYTINCPNKLFKTCLRKSIYWLNLNKNQDMGSSLSERKFHQLYIRCIY